MEGALIGPAISPDGVVGWGRRHVGIVIVVLAQLVGLVVLALVRGGGLVHATTEVLPGATLVVVASLPAVAVRWRSVATSRVARTGDDEAMRLILEVAPVGMGVTSPDEKGSDLIAVMDSVGALVQAAPAYLTMATHLEVAAIDRGPDAADLLDAADTALDEAKARGRDQWVLYDETMRRGLGTPTPLATVVTTAAMRP